jgi:hypothetical protein
LGAYRSASSLNVVAGTYLDPESDKLSPGIRIARRQIDGHQP